MAVGYIRPAGGLSRADKETAKQWMVEGHSILQGKVEGTIPEQTNYSYIMPMMGTDPITLPAGYYGNDIVVTPAFVSGTVLSDFSDTGPCGGYVVRQANSIFTALQGHGVDENGSAYIVTHYSNNDDVAHTGGSNTMIFQKPLNLDGYSTLIIRGSGWVGLSTSATSTGTHIKVAASASGAQLKLTNKACQYLFLKAEAHYIGGGTHGTATARVISIEFYV